MKKTNLTINKKSRSELLSMTVNDLIAYTLTLQDLLVCNDASTSEETSVEKSEEKSAKKQGKTPSAEPKKSDIAEPKKSAGKSAEKKTRKWTEKTIVIVNDGDVVDYAEKDGSYVYDNGVRKYMGNLLKVYGAKWDKDKRVWRCPDADAAEKATGELTITAPEIDSYMNEQSKKWAEKAAKKAAKAGK